MDEITNIQNFFKSHQVHLSRIWLESCIDWCKKENLPPNYSLKNLQFNVFEQWLLLDLRDLEVPCLPPNLSSEEKYTLTENYTLQLMQVVDISKPKYWQLQRIRSGIPKNLEQEFENTKRVLQLTLTDGVQDVEAMEYKPIKCLNLNLSPGIKIRLMGPIQMRRGRLMLEERHVKVLGGEVDSLLISNAAENVLAKHLNQPFNPKPEIIQENLLVANKETVNETQVADNKTTQLMRNLTNNRGNTNVINNTNEVKFVSSTPKVDNNFPVHMNDFVDEDFQIDQEIEMIMEVERDFEQSKPNKRKTPDLFDDTDIDFESVAIPNLPEPSICKNSSRNDTGLPINISDSPDGRNSIEFINKSDIQNTTNTQKNMFTSPIATVMWSVEKLLKTMPNITSGKFKIKAKFKKIVEKMCVLDDSFHLVVEVEDATGAIPLKFHSDVVAELIGYSAKEFWKLREELAKDNAEAKSKTIGALSSLKNRLTDLDHVLVVLINGKEKFPTLVQIL